MSAVAISHSHNISQMGFGGRRTAWKRVCVSAVALDLPWVTCQMRPTIFPHYSQNVFLLRNSTSDSLDRTESVSLGGGGGGWGLPHNHHKDVTLVTTAALSAKLCYPAVIEESDQCRIDNLLEPAIKLLDRDIQRHNCQKAQDQWRILLESSDSATNPSVTGFFCANWAASGRIGHQTFQLPSRENPTLARRRLC